MELKPLLVTRVCNALLWPFLGALLVDRLVEDDVPGGIRVAGVVVAVVGALYLGVMGWRMGVEIRQDSVRVRGVIRSRTIPRGRIAEITTFPAVRWTTAAGRPHWTPILAFASFGGVLPVVERHNDAALEALWGLRLRRRHRDSRR